MKNTSKHFQIFWMLLFLFININFSSAQERWPGEKAGVWYEQYPWLVGMNYTPAYAINQLEMWQEETFDLNAIDKELQWAEDLGFNTARVFLHDLLWEEHPAAFLQRIDSFLDIADKHDIKIMFVLFDSVWDPEPHSGKQRSPKKGVHNSGWVQSPGIKALQDSINTYPRLERYVKGVIGRFGHDHRVIVWDLVNEADNRNPSSYVDKEPDNKRALGLSLLKNSFQWAREVLPSQPLTSGIWSGNWESLETMNEMEKFLVMESDVISFHSYDKPDEYEKRVKYLQALGRPLFCTEYMARPRGSTFKEILPVAKKYDVASYNWGFVEGKSNTIYPWDSWKKPYPNEPELWFHDIFRTSGKPYIQEEVTFIKNILDRN